MKDFVCIYLEVFRFIPFQKSLALMAEKNTREVWSHRIAFISAAVGSAVGLGNIWRFPNLTYYYGGSAFLIPYFIALFLIGIPILTLEFALGQVFRSGDVYSFAALHHRFAGVGLGSIFCSFNVVCYYVVIIAWAMNFFIQSFQGTDSFNWLPYMDVTGLGGSFFWDKIAQVGSLTLDNGDFNRSASTVGPTVAYVTIVWVLMFACIARGAKMVGRITYVTMFGPFIVLVILAFYFGNLSGGPKGVELFFEADMTKIEGKGFDQAWPDAVGQVFFSIGVTFGVMTAYASYNPTNQGTMADATICALSDTLTSLIASITVFGAVGVVANIDNVSAESVATTRSGGFGLIFVTMPTLFQKLGESPYDLSFDGRKTLSVFFFGTVVLLGIDSAFSMVEGVATSLKDATVFQNWPKEAVTGAICVVGYLVSIEYCGDNGLFGIDAVDYYITVSMLFVGLIETFVAGWLAHGENQEKKIGSPARYTAMFAVFFSSLVAVRVGFGVGSWSDSAEDGTITGVVCGVILCIALMLVALKMAAKHSNRRVSKGLVYDVLLLNVEDLRSQLNASVGKNGNIPIPLVWSILIKFYIPPVLITCLWMKFKSVSFGAYEGYPQYYQGWGLFVGFLPWLVLLVGFIHPPLLHFCWPKWVNVKQEDYGQGDKIGNAVSEEPEVDVA